MRQTPSNQEKSNLTEILDLIYKFAVGDYTARGVIAGDGSMMDGVMAGINILGEELQAKVAESKQAQKTLSESEAALRIIFDSIQDGIVVTDVQNKRYIMVNASMCKMLGYSRDELLSLGVNDVHPKQDLPHILHEFERVVKGDIRIAPNIPMKRKNGSVFYADISSTTPLKINGTNSLIGVFRDISERKRAEKAEEIASHDGLTNLYNYRKFHSFLKDEIIRSQRFNRPVSLLMLDIDHFKQVNDTHGHQAGDAVLKGISDLLMSQSRAVDRVCRYGGEEITIILPETDVTLAMEIADRLRAAVEGWDFDIGGGKIINITISVGVAAYPKHADSVEALVKASDVALYAAKNAGRNCVSVSSVAEKDLPEHT
jgi:diguanylate cyclase (GGDEF)-like protein/PAS domain S-box-containing protein